MILFYFRKQTKKLRIEGFEVYAYEWLVLRGVIFFDDVNCNDVEVLNSLNLDLWEVNGDFLEYIRV